MESNDNGSKTKSLSERVTENRLSYNELLTCSSSRPQIELLELEENIQRSKSNYETIQMPLKYLKCLHRDEIYSPNDGGNSQRSISSFSSLKITTSEHSIQKEDTSDNHDIYGKREMENLMNGNLGENRIHINLTPRTPKNENHKELVPHLDIRDGESQESIKTNKRAKKIHKSKKKSQGNKTNENTVKTSTIPSAKSEIKSKRKKFHGRLKNSNSKSTVITRDTIFSDKKADRKKFKRQKSLDAIPLLQMQPLRKRANTLKTRESKQLNSKEFVEIYHNSAVKSGSYSLVSSRHSKIAPSHISQLQEESVRAVGDSKSKKDIPIPEEIIDNTLQINMENVNNREENESLMKNDNQCEAQKEQMNICTAEPYDPFHQRNYEMPTMASKMKRVHRSYFDRLALRNIPFVVGTSISPSHNIGLNIQQVLSIIKTKQPAVPGISPLLIRKVSRGIRPVSTLFEHINSQYTKSCRNLVSFQDTNQDQNNNLGFRQNSYSCEYLRSINSTTTSTTTQGPFKQNFTCDPLYEEDEDSHSNCSENCDKNQILQRKSTCCDRHVVDSEATLTIGSKHQNQLGRQRQLKKNGQQLTEVIGDSLMGNNINYSNNSKEMTDVFRRLYDQFDKMITQHEKLKEQSEKRRDKSFIKEVSEMEAEINAKEQEINVVANLYNEVMALRQQMKLLQERNSLVCITTEDTAYQQTTKSVKTQRRATTTGAFEFDSQCKYQNRKVSSLHETPNALRLTWLLRQIQAFQRQLSLA